MTTIWPLLPLSEVLSRSTETIDVDPVAEYQEITVKLWGKGVIRRGWVTGARVAASRRQVARTGQFILSRIDARNGALGVVPPTLDRAIVSNDFPVFEPVQDRLLPSYLGWLCRTRDFVEGCARASEGSTNRVRLSVERFLALEIRLPNLDHQRRIVGRIEELAAKIGEARLLRQSGISNVESLLGAHAGEVFRGPRTCRWTVRRLGDVAEIQSGVTLGRRLTGKTIRLPYLRVANVQDGHLDLSRIKEVEVLPTEIAKWRLKAGDLLLTEGGDWDKLGRGAIWREEIPDCIHQNHVFRLRTRPDEFVPEFVAALIGSPIGKAYFQAASKKTTNLASINQRQLKAFSVFQPPLSEQRLIVAEIATLETEVSRLKWLQAETAAELDALLPSVLDRAFAGALTL